MGPGATEKQREVVAAVLANPALADVFAKMLEAVGNDPASLEMYSREACANALNTLPPTVARTKGRWDNALTSMPEYVSHVQDVDGGGYRWWLKATSALRLTSVFKLVVELEHGKLELRTGAHSAYEWRLTYKNVARGKEEEKGVALVAEINKLLLSQDNCPSGWIIESKEAAAPWVKEAGNPQISGTSLIHTHHSTFQSGDDARASGVEAEEYPEETLKQLGLFPIAEPSSAVIAAGLFRLYAGFPDRISDIGTLNDLGDLYEGESAMFTHRRYVRSSRKGVNSFTMFKPGENQGVISRFYEA